MEHFDELLDDFAKQIALIHAWAIDAGYPDAAERLADFPEYAEIVRREAELQKRDRLEIERQFEIAEQQFEDQREQLDEIKANFAEYRELVERQQQERDEADWWKQSPNDDTE